MWNAKQHSYEELRDVVIDVLHQRISGNNQYPTRSRALKPPSPTCAESTMRSRQINGLTKKLALQIL
jgi:hypothetical protein